MTIVLKYLMAGILVTEPTTDIADCLNRMEALPYVERVRARCVGEHVTLHWHDVRKPEVSKPSVGKIIPPAIPSFQTVPCADYYAAQDALIKGKISATCNNI